MHYPITTFWGKLNHEAQTWHLLVDHCADVAACCYALLTRTLLGERLARAGGLPHLEPVLVERLCFLAALHDLGKFNRGFQAKAGKLAGANVDTAGHTTEMLAVLGCSSEVRKNLFSAVDAGAWQQWSGDPNTAFFLLVAAICHHGKPYPLGGLSLAPEIWEPGSYGDPLAGMRELIDSAKQWFPRAYECGPLLPSAPQFQHQFAGLVMLADWIGSDTTWFPYSEPDAPSRFLFARARAVEVVDRLGIGGGFRRALSNPRDSFQAILPPGCSPRPLQRALLDAELPGSGIVVLEAQTGSGKTEAAAAWFLRLLDAGLVDGLYFALPTRTAATQLQARLSRAIDRVWTNRSSAPAVTLAVPGYLRAGDSTGTQLPGFEVLWSDDPPKHRTWASEHPKRYLAGSVVVGTLDQVLLSALMTSHAHMRATCLSRVLLVVDEVHASDVYMQRLLTSVLHEHVRNGGHALLLSATLGSEMQAALLATCEPESLETQSPPPLSVVTARHYPLATFKSPGRAAAETCIDNSGQTKSVQLATVAIADEPHEIVQLAVAAALKGARVLVIRNTVSDCIATQVALEQSGHASLGFRCKGVTAPHHSRFAPQDRKLLDASLEQAFGKSSVRDGGLVVCATQTVEQSLDIDADLLLTDLCPADVLLQRIGRLHRHTRPRPSGFEEPRCVVLVPQTRDLSVFVSNDGVGRGPHGLGTVYADLRGLAATWELVDSGGVEIPAQNREWVESTTHREALAKFSKVPGTPGERWQQHAAHILGIRLVHTKFAKGALIPRETPFGQVTFPSREDAIHEITTRLGARDVIVRLASPTRSPYYGTLNEVKIPGHLVKGLDTSQSLEVQPIPDPDNPGIFSFAIQGFSFIYSNLGLHKAQ